MNRAASINHDKLILNLAGSLSVTAALIHLMVMPEHFEEWWGYGIFFFVVASAQMLYGVILFWQSWELGPSLPALWQDQGRMVYLAGIGGNLIVMVLYGITRTIGVPVGPSAGEIEALSPTSLTSKGLELALIGCLLVLLRWSRSRTVRQSLHERPRRILARLTRMVK